MEETDEEILKKMPEQFLKYLEKGDIESVLKLENRNLRYNLLSIFK